MTNLMRDLDLIREGRKRVRMEEEKEREREGEGERERGYCDRGLASHV